MELGINSDAGVKANQSWGMERYLRLWKTTEQRLHTVTVGFLLMSHIHLAISTMFTLKHEMLTTDTMKLYRTQSACRCTTITPKTTTDF